MTGADRAAPDTRTWRQVRLDRTTTAVRLDLTKLLTAGGHTPATDDEIDAALDQQ